jgi:hypothetical protein
MGKANKKRGEAQTNSQSMNQQTSGGGKNLNSGAHSHKKKIDPLETGLLATFRHQPSFRAS